jgi:hypothetical protein
MDSSTQIGPNFNKDRTTPMITPRREWLIARAKCLSQVIDDCLSREEVVAVLGMVVELQSLLDLICAESPINHSLGGGMIPTGRTR